MTKHLALTSVSSTATTYAFRAEDGDGWALCTINDKTGELAIVSDWGNWSHRWSPTPSSLGNATLTHFIADRGSVDYLANKLLGRRGAVEFSCEETTKHFRAELARVRFIDGSEYNERLRDCGDEDDRQIAISRGLLEKKYDGTYYLTKDQARQLWDDLGELDDDLRGSEHADAIYIERLMRLDNFASIFEEPWNETQHRESRDYKVLNEMILPALVAATGDHVAKDAGYLKLRAEYEASKAAAAVPS